MHLRKTSPLVELCSPTETWLAPELWEGPLGNISRDSASGKFVIARHSVSDLLRQAMRHRGGPHLLMGRELEDVGRLLLDIVNPQAWLAAEIPERMRLAHSCHICIRQAYGLEPSPLLYDIHLPPHVAGRFDSEKRQVSINSSLLEDNHPGELLGTLAHENRHAVQLLLLSWPTLDPPELWSDAWFRYDSSDPHAYFSNQLEIDARRSGLHLAGNGYWRTYLDRIGQLEPAAA